jgi:hypothetical protein
MTPGRHEGEDKRSKTSVLPPDRSREQRKEGRGRLMAKRDFLRLPVVSASAESLVMSYLMRRNVLAYKAPPNNEGYDLICIHLGTATNRRVTNRSRSGSKSRVGTPRIATEGRSEPHRPPLVQQSWRLTRGSKEPPMFFREMLKSDADRQSFDQTCAAFSDFFLDCNRCLVTAWGMAQEAAALTNEEHHTPILLLVRHVIESLDGAVRRSTCSRLCAPAGEAFGRSLRPGEVAAASGTVHGNGR